MSIVLEYGKKLYANLFLIVSIITFDTEVKSGKKTKLIHAQQTCTPLFFRADPTNTGVNALLIVARRMAAYQSKHQKSCFKKST